MHAHNIIRATRNSSNMRLSVLPGHSISMLSLLPRCNIPSPPALAYVRLAPVPSQVPFGQAIDGPRLSRVQVHTIADYVSPAACSWALPISTPTPQFAVVGPLEQEPIPATPVPPALQGVDGAPDNQLQSTTCQGLCGTPVNSWPSPAYSVPPGIQLILAPPAALLLVGNSVHLPSTNHMMLSV